MTRRTSGTSRIRQAKRCTQTATTTAKFSYSKTSLLALALALGLGVSAMALTTANRYGASQQSYQNLQPGASLTPSSPYDMSQMVDQLSYQDAQAAPSAVPEPATVILLGMGMAATAWRARRRSMKSQT